MSLATYIKDPNALKDYGIDWSPWLETGDTISTSTWVVPSGITSVTQAHTTTAALIRVSGGTDAISYELKNTITTVNGLIDERSITIQVSEESGTSTLVDAAFGSLYLSVDEFVIRAEMFGLSNALPTDPFIVSSYLAAASRWIDAKTCKTFSSGDHTEQHAWNPVTRRVYVNNPPVTTVSSFKIFTGPTTYANMPTSALFVNNQESWVELAAITAAYNLVSQLLTLGLYQPIVEIIYKSSGSVKESIKLATGYLAASMMDQNYLSSKLPVGIKSIKIGSSAQIVRDTSSGSGATNGGFSAPSIVDLLLARDIAIGIA